MDWDWQGLIVIAVVVAAALYLGRGLWPRRRGAAGCTNCAAATRKRDDYT